MFIKIRPLLLLAGILLLFIWSGSPVHAAQEPPTSTPATSSEETPTPTNKPDATSEPTAHPTRDPDGTVEASPTSTLEASPTPRPSITPTEAPTSTANPEIIPTEEPSPTPTLEPSLTPTPEPTWVESPTTTPESEPPLLNEPAESIGEETAVSGLIYMPMIAKSPPPVQTLYFCSYPNTGIPDDRSWGVSDSIKLTNERTILDLDVRLDINHTWIGDITATLTHQQSGTYVNLVDRPGVPKHSLGCSANNIKAILDDDISLPVENQCSGSPAGIAGIFRPNQPLFSFDDLNPSGTWTLNVADHDNGDTGRFNSWCMAVTVGHPSQKPQPTPDPPPLPNMARITNISGKAQALPLDCESRVAVDWAAYFGVRIGEFEFFNNLPKSDNPDKGFVGDVYGQWGQIPPNPYGVHAEPVADLLMNYGLQAYAHRPLSWDRLRSEIAVGRPVYVWTISYGWMNGIPIYYQSSDGHTSIVASKEHTVMVIGYDLDRNTVTILDGGTVYTLGIPVFLASWSALGNMAITATP